MSSTAETSSALTTLIRSDRAGRARYTPEFREQVLAAYDASGMTSPAFAEHCGVKYPTLASWLRRRDRDRDRDLDAPSGAAPHQFVLAEMAAPSGVTDSHALRVTLPGGSVAEVSSTSQADLLARVIKGLC